MVLVQKWPFWQLFFLKEYRAWKFLYGILEEKNAFLGYQNKKFKKWKYSHFSKGVNPWFSSKNGHFGNLFILGNVGQENVFYNTLEQENSFLDYKNKNFKKSKYWHFSKGVNPRFWSKNGYFGNFFFRQYRPGECLLRYSRTKKRLSRL